MEILRKTAMIAWMATIGIGMLPEETLARNGDFSPYWGMHPMWGIGGVFMMILMFIFWAAVIVGIILFIRWMFTGRPISLDRGETPLDILKKRFARGEIDRQEFEDKKKLLE